MDRRRIAIASAALLGAVAVVYSAAWFYVAGQVQDGIEGWADERRAEGWRIAYRSLAIEGFPLAFRGRIEAPVLARQVAGKAVSWRGPAITIAVRPWDPRRLSLSFSGSHEFSRGGRARTARLTAGTADAHVELGEDGQVRVLRVALGSLTVTPKPDAPKTTLEKLDLTLDRPPVAQTDAPHQRPLVRIAADVAGLVLPDGTRAVLGPRIESAGITVVLLGAIPAGPLEAALAAWRDSGGTLEVERFRLAWATLSLNAEGTLALDRELQPMGALAARIIGFRATVDRLTANGINRPRQAMTAKIVLGLLARGSPPEIKVPISAQDGGLYLGPVRFMRLPRVNWK